MERKNNQQPSERELLLGRIKSGESLGDSERTNLEFMVGGLSDEEYEAINIRRKISEAEGELNSVDDIYDFPLSIDYVEAKEIRKCVRLAGFALQVSNNSLNEAVLMEVARAETSPYLMGGALRLMENFKDISVGEDGVIRPEGRLANYLEKRASNQNLKNRGL